MPIGWPFILNRLYKTKIIAKYVISPYQKPWDFIFGKRESYWIIVHLKDGRNIGGKYGVNSFASSAPADEQIFLEEVWQLNSIGKFVKQINNSKGIIIMREEISSIEFIKL